MAGRERRLERSVRLMQRDLEEAAAELRQARLRAGLTLESVPDALSVSPSTVLRTELAKTPGLRPIMLAQHAAVVGLRARIRLYPEGEAVRDAGQVALIRRFRERIGDAGLWAFEVPIPLSGDQRALDAVLTVSGGRIGLEFYTRLADVQAQLRAANLKKRDAGLERMLVVVQATRGNRRALKQAGSALAEFPGSSRRMFRTLSSGALPATDGVIVF
jgi:transcriptional regulator with XRE-family HTH domain